MDKLIIKFAKRKYKNDTAISWLCKYIAGDGRKKQMCYYHRGSGISSKPLKASSQIIKTQQAYCKTNGRRCYQLIISFPKDLDDSDVVVQIAKEVADYLFYSLGFQSFLGVHKAKNGAGSLHIHYIINSVSYIDGKKWHMGNKQFAEFKDSVQEIVNDTMEYNGLNVLSL